MSEDPFEELLEYQRRRFRELDAELEPSLFRALVKFALFLGGGIAIGFFLLEWMMKGPTP